MSYFFIVWHCFLRFTDDEVLGNPDRVVDAIEKKVRQLEEGTTTLNESTTR